MEKKMVETIEKKLGVTVDEVLEVVQEDKEATVYVSVGENDYRKVVLKEMKNQYGIYYKIVSDSQYTRETVEEDDDPNDGVDMNDIYDEETINKMEWGKEEDEEENTVKVEIINKNEKKAATSLKTKTERLCGARRKDIITYAEERIEQLADGSATLKEIEGPAKEDTAIRFVLILKADGTRVKEDIDIEEIRESIGA